MMRAMAAKSGRAMALAGLATMSGMTKSVVETVKLGATSVFSILTMENADCGGVCMCVYVKRRMEDSGVWTC